MRYEQLYSTLENAILGYFSQKKYKQVEVWRYFDLEKINTYLMYTDNWLICEYIFLFDQLCQLFTYLLWTSLKI